MHAVHKERLRESTQTQHHHQTAPAPCRAGPQVIFTLSLFKEPHLQTLQMDGSSQIGELLYHACTSNDSLRNWERKRNLKQKNFTDNIFILFF